VPAQVFRALDEVQTTGSLAGSTCSGSRFTDNGDQTVTDNFSGLVWEKKEGLDNVPNLLNAHDADNAYTLSVGAPYKENGTAFTSLLAMVNGGGGFGGANAWRLPTFVELETILADFECDDPVTCTCPSTPCIDPALDAANTRSAFYWSATTFVPNPIISWIVNFNDSNDIDSNVRSNTWHVRAVRGGL
jgi:uncharacterized protein DUF1566